MSMSKFQNLIQQGINGGISDISLTGGHPVVVRRDGNIQFLRSEIWRHAEIDQLVFDLLRSNELENLRARFSVDIARTIQNIRIRVNIFNSMRGLSLSIRLLPGSVPELAKLNLHPSLKNFCRLSAGLILICGATGSGKSSTMAAMIEEVNRTRACHIITLEDPVEYRFASKQSFIEQREHNTHFPSFHQGLVDVLREDPDVILVGELRDPETIRLTLNAAESGHLVIASLHATNAEDALYRISNSFQAEMQEMVRSQLASTLALLVVQRLMKHPRAGFRVPHLSILRGTQSVKGIIRSNKLSQVESAMQTGKDEGMFTLEKYKSDFLDQISQFMPPTDNFRPSTENNFEEIYLSTVFNEGSPVQRRPPQTEMSPSPRKQPLESQRTSLDFVDGDAIHIIDEAGSMDEVVSEFYETPDRLDLLLQGKSLFDKMK